MNINHARLFLFLIHSHEQDAFRGITGGKEMLKKRNIGVIILLVFIFFLICLSIPNSGLCQCYPPYPSDYLSGGRVYIGDDWQLENYLLIENSSNIIFNNVNTTFHYHEWRYNSFGDAFPSLSKWVTICQGTYSETTAFVPFTPEEGAKLNQVPDLSCSSNDITHNYSTIKPKETFMIEYPPYYSSWVYQTVRFVPTMSFNCCIEKDQDICTKSEERKPPDQIITNAIAGCDWEGITLTGDNILTGGWLGCTKFYPWLDDTSMDLGQWFPIWVSGPPKDTKITITPSVESAKPGENFTLTIEYESLTDNSLENVVIIAPIPEQTVYIDGSAKQISGVMPVYNAELNRLEWNLGTIPPHIQGQGTYEVLIDTCLPSDVIAISGLAGTWVNGHMSDNDNFNVALDTMELNLKVQEKTANAGDILHYTVKVNNLMDCPQTFEEPGITLTLPIPDMDLGVSFVSADQGGEFVSTAVEWTIPSLTDEELVFHMNVQLPDAVPDELLTVKNQAYMMIPPWDKFQNSNYVKTIIGQYIIWGWIKDVKPYFYDQKNPLSTVYYKFNEREDSVLAGVTVELWKYEEMQEILIQTTVSDDDISGNYYLKAGEPGAYLIKVKANTEIGELVYERQVLLTEDGPANDIQADFTFPSTLIKLETSLIQEMRGIDQMLIPILQLLPQDTPDVNNLLNLLFEGQFIFKYNMDRAQEYLDYLKWYNETEHPQDIDEGQKQNLARLVGAHTFMFHQARDAAVMADDAAKNIALVISMCQFLKQMQNSPGKMAESFIDDWTRQWGGYLSNKLGKPIDEIAEMGQAIRSGLNFKLERLTALITSASWYQFVFREPVLGDPARNTYLKKKDLFFRSVRMLTSYFVNRLAGDIDFEITFQTVRSTLDYVLMSALISATQTDVDNAAIYAAKGSATDSWEEALGQLSVLDTEMRARAQAAHSTAADLSVVVSGIRGLKGIHDILAKAPEITFWDQLKYLKLDLQTGFQQGVEYVHHWQTYVLLFQVSMQATTFAVSVEHYYEMIAKSSEGVSLAFSDPVSEVDIQSLKGSLEKSPSLTSIVKASNGSVPELENYAQALNAVLAGLENDPVSTANNLIPLLMNADDALAPVLEDIFYRLMSSPSGIVNAIQSYEALKAFCESNAQRAILYSKITAYLLDPAQEELNGIFEQAALLLSANESAYTALAPIRVVLEGVSTNPLLVIRSLEVPRSICPDLPITVTATIENIGDTPAEDIEAELAISEHLALLSPASQDIGTVGPHATATVTWQIRKTDLDSSYLQVLATGVEVTGSEETDWILTEKADIDNDGMPNCWELTNNLNPHDDTDAVLDPDTDNLSNLDEYIHQTNPQNPDTDGDHIPDGAEVALGLDPLVPNANVLEHIIDLTAFRTSSSSVSLTFTAPGYDGLGRANSYDLRYATTVITEANWASATSAYGEQTPLAAGTQESITVRGLEGNTTYYFALRGIDYEGKVAPLSNVVIAKTAGMPDWTREPDPVLSPGGAVIFDVNGVYHPAVIYDITDPAYPNGVYKMWYSGASPGGQYGDENRIGYAISRNGIVWEKVLGQEAGGSVIDISEVGGFIETQIGTPSVVKDETANPDERYKLWYYQRGIGIPYSNGTIYCTSPDGIHWNKVGRVFGSSAVAGRFDENTAYFPNIVLDLTESDPLARYKLWYTGVAANGEYGIGYATSPDGINWTRIDGPNPDKSVLTKGKLGSFDEAIVWTPSVKKIDDVYVMFYSGVGSRSYTPDESGAGGQVRTIGYAVSKDCINWDKVISSGPGSCSLDAGTAGHFDEEGGVAPSMLWNGTTLKIWYGVSVPDGSRLIGHATASPGLNSLLSLKSVGEADIGSKGGMVSVNDPESLIASAAVIVPPGVLDTLTTITIGEFTGALPPLDKGAGIGLPIHFGPEGIDFSPYKVTIVIPYTNEVLAEIGFNDPNLLDVYTFNPAKQQWELVSGLKRVDTVNNLIMIEVSHFSIFQLGIAQSNLVIEVPVDIKPRSCPNTVNVTSKGVLPVAILGTSNVEVSMIDSNSVRLLGVVPVKTNREDVAAPYIPYLGKDDANDCNWYGPDGVMDLTLKFDTQAIVQAIEDALGRSVKDKEVVTLPLEGKLLEEFGGSLIKGEDVIVIQNKKK
jgi:hypothetical protein